MSCNFGIAHAQEDVIFLIVRSNSLLQLVSILFPTATWNIKKTSFLLKKITLLDSGISKFNTDPVLSCYLLLLSSFTKFIHLLLQFNATCYYYYHSKVKRISYLV